MNFFQLFLSMQEFEQPLHVSNTLEVPIFLSATDILQKSYSFKQWPSSASSNLSIHRPGCKNFEKEDKMKRKITRGII